MYCHLRCTERLKYKLRQQAIIYANDIDIICVQMTYLQLSYMGASAIIEHKNTLTQEKWNEYRTLAYLIGPKGKPL